MKPSRERFAKQLTSALYRAKSVTNKGIGILEDEVGYAVGRNGGDFVRYLRKGNIPAALADIEQLTQALIQQGGLDRQRAADFLVSAGHPAVGKWVESWFGADPLANRMASTPANTMASTPANRTAPVMADAITALRHPFVAGPPIMQPHQFFGRKREVQQVFHSWQGAALEHLAIVGPRRSGKTSLLHFAHQIATVHAPTLRMGQVVPTLNGSTNGVMNDTTTWQWVQVDFQDPRMGKQEALLRHLLTGLHLPIPVHCTLDNFVDVVTDQGVACNSIIVIDELDTGLRMAEFDQAFWLALRFLLNTPASGQIAFLVTSCVSPIKLATEVGKTSPLFNMFKTLPLGPFPEAEALEFLAASPLPFSPADRAWILRESGLWPALLQHLCEERLFALQQGETDQRWQTEGLRRIEPYRYLLDRE